MKIVSSIRSQNKQISAIMPLLLKRTKHKAQFFREQLNDTVSLDMILIPGGTFLMGSPEDEIDRSPDESPQHSVTVPSFCMGKYSITQAQWRVVANLPQLERKLNPEPSKFIGDDRPVEQVSWFDAQEFCARLSDFTNREYRLPSEAEWEYACRADTTSPFHFGETISTDLANYRGTDNKQAKKSGSYDRGSTGIYREETTSVDTFPPNIFGLYDMHGNIREWCLDHRHNDYQGAPTDGSAWISSADRNAPREIRGGSWYSYPRNCRSACRIYSFDPDDHHFSIGLRVVCDKAITH
jgi:formylglycine-generating enzyme required for sulfatase activity